MFVRKVSNRSGSFSVQIISKESGKYRVVKTLGSSLDPDVIECLVYEAKQAISQAKGQLKLLSVKTKDELAVESFVSQLKNSQIHTIGPELIFGTLFDRIGFSAVESSLFRHLTVARLAYPTSKLKTVDYLYRYRNIKTSKDAIYRFLDNLGNKYKGKVENISYQYTKTRLKTITAVFYDMTTLHFETEDGDDLRKIGFSKNGKFQKPQIMLGLLVGEEGLPISYDIYEGNTFEGHTLMPFLNKTQQRYGFIKKPVVIADAALLSQKNLKNLSQQQYSFIIAGRIKNENNQLKAKILKKAKGLENNQGFSIKKEDGNRLVITYSDKRAKKDAFNRKRGLKKLRKRIKSGRLSKDHINNRGYNKFLKIIGKNVKDIRIIIDEDKIKEDKNWDGLKGYITNTSLNYKTIVKNYSHLWQIEKAFRISKTDLKIRPIYHRLKHRIQAHICISFVAYTIYKELELILKRKNIAISPKRAAELTQNMYELEYLLVGELKKRKIILQMDDEQKLLYKAIYK